MPVALQVVPVDEPLPVEDVQECYLYSLPLPSLPCTPFLVAPIRTEPDSLTRPAPATLEFVNHDTTGLKKLWYCPTVWKRLLAYVSLGASLKYRDDDAVKEDFHHLAQCPGAPAHPPLSYETGYRQMFAVEAAHHKRPQPTVCNIEGVQDAVHSQIIDFINGGLQMRYENLGLKYEGGNAEAAAIEGIENDDGNDNDNDNVNNNENENGSDSDSDDDNDNNNNKEYAYMTTAGKEVTVAEIKANTFYPAWLRTCRKNHINHGREGNRTAGFSDKMLFVSPDALDNKDPKRTQVALHEAKPSWVYSTKYYRHILRGNGAIIDDDNNFNTLNKLHPGNLLLKQLWGQCSDLGPDVGFTTNGDVVMVFVRVVPPVAPQLVETTSKSDDPADSKIRHQPPRSKGVKTSKVETHSPALPETESGFILSPLMKWIDPRLRVCLLALSFMALDEASWMTKQVNGNPSPITLRNLLCPESECTQIEQEDV
ncbi:hypothetical protein BDN70DRAFT_990392 [Pholiota conissans]|uniref:Uncharacterized protein n=1 Tax=Pholiota conissans TaxID=109636 RepID=A0A9P5ZAX0_9AGAR|nr:hypothetical protein BDN70DRAFT_990392 [Pholiota conissans]